MRMSLVTKHTQMSWLLSEIKSPWRRASQGHTPNSRTELLENTPRVINPVHRIHNIDLWGHAVLSWSTKSRGVAAQLCQAETLSLLLSSVQAGLPFWPGSGPWECAHGHGAGFGRNIHRNCNQPCKRLSWSSAGRAAISQGYLENQHYGTGCLWNIDTVKILMVPSCSENNLMNNWIVLQVPVFTLQY